MYHLLLTDAGRGRGVSGRRAFAMAAACLTVMVSACGSAENANNAASSNANRMSNVVYTNSTANASSTALSTAANTASNSMTTITELTQMTLTFALKTRIYNDARGELAEPDWDADRWLEVPLGRFYRNDDEFAKDAVCRAIDDALARAGRRLRGAPRLNLRRAIDKKTMCRLAVVAMRDASLESEPINSIP